MECFSAQVANKCSGKTCKCIAEGDHSLVYLWHAEAGGVHYLSGSYFVSIRVHGGQDVNACVMDQPRDPLVSCPILFAQKLGELNEQLAAEHFITVHVAHVLELWLHWGGSEVWGDMRSKSHI